MKINKLGALAIAAVLAAPAAYAGGSHHNSWGGINFGGPTFGNWNWTPTYPTGGKDCDPTPPPVSTVPLPAGGLLLMTGFGAFGALRRKKKA